MKDRRNEYLEKERLAPKRRDILSLVRKYFVKKPILYMVATLICVAFALGYAKYLEQLKVDLSLIDSILRENADQYRLSINSDQIKIDVKTGTEFVAILRSAAEKGHSYEISSKNIIVFGRLEQLHGSRINSKIYFFHGGGGLGFHMFSNGREQCLVLSKESSRETVTMIEELLQNRYRFWPGAGGKYSQGAF